MNIKKNDAFTFDILMYLFMYISPFQMNKIQTNEAQTQENLFIQLFLHSFPKFRPHPFNQVEVWTLTGSLQHRDSFLFLPFCCNLLPCLESLSHDPVRVKLWLSYGWLHI